MKLLCDSEQSFHPSDVDLSPGAPEAIKFEVGAARDGEELFVFPLCAASIALGDIAGDRDARAKPGIACPF